MDLIIVWFFLAFVILGGLIGLFEVLVEAIKNSDGKAQGPHQVHASKPDVLTTRIAGVSHQNETGPSRQVCLERLTPYDEIWLSADPESRFDRNAIKVLSEKGQLGFLPREVAADLSGSDLSAVSVELRSKGQASNGLWGCTVELKLSKPSTRVEPTIKSREQGFKKDSAIEAARAGRLGRNQLLAVIDQASHLGLDQEELAIFEVALRKARVPKTERPPLAGPSGRVSSRYYDDPIDPTDIDHDNGFDGVGEYWHEYHKHD